MTDLSPAQVAQALTVAFAQKDRAAAQPLIAPDFHFTSPLDNRIDRAAYFEICWPNSRHIEGFEIVRLIEHGDTAVITYVGRTDGGKQFRNTEVFTVRNGQAVEVEVYFGWSIPHEAAPGAHKDPG